MFDLVIGNGIVVDGTGGEPYPADVAVRNGRIEIISAGIEAAPGVNFIDARGLAVSPGFIDMHSHSDFTLLANPRAESKIRQGITTEVVGNCGFTAAPVCARRFKELMQYLVNTVTIDEQAKRRWRWKTEHLFIEEIAGQGTAVNLIPLVGHGTIRIAVMGFEARVPTARELKRMSELLEEELRQGIWGLSTGLQYDPGTFASLEELVALAGIVAGRGGLYTTHLKSEGRYLLECIGEAVAIGEKSGVSVQISHLKAQNPANWGKVVDALELVDRARGKGTAVDFDVYPYTAFGSGLMDLVPPWLRERGAAVMVNMLRRVEYRNRALREMERPDPGWENPMEGMSWDKVRIATVKSEQNSIFEGKDLAQAARMMGCDPCSAVLRLLLEEEGAVKIVFFGMCEEDLLTLIKHPRAIFCTDGRAVAPYGELARGKIHPRYYGTYPRILGSYVRDKQVISLAEAVKKATLLPALKLNLGDRGLIKEGYHADITVFDPERIIDCATFDQPHRYPAGVEHVIVNGEPVIVNREHSGKLPGRILSRPYH